MVEVTVQTYPTFLAATVLVVGHYPELRREVRAGWRRVNELLPPDHPNRIDDDCGFVFIPNWKWRINGQQVLLVGVEVKDVRELSEDMIGLHIPEREYVTAKVRGGEDTMMDTYSAIHEWISDNDYEIDPTQGVYGFEVNSLKPVNPFDIPHDRISYFDYDVYNAVRKKSAHIGATG